METELERRIDYQKTKINELQRGEIELEAIGKNARIILEKAARLLEETRERIDIEQDTLSKLMRRA